MNNGDTTETSRTFPTKSAPTGQLGEIPLYKIAIFAFLFTAAAFGLLMLIWKLLLGLKADG
jgi:hypothetical protein